MPRASTHTHILRRNFSEMKRVYCEPHECFVLEKIFCSIKYILKLQRSKVLFTSIFKRTKSLVEVIFKNNMLNLI